MRKYILIPEYRPLYAMKECFGPTNGPLTKPTPVPVDVIGKLLLQKGNEKVSIYEVLKNLDGTTTAPVQLTLENFRKPYAEITGTPAEKPKEKIQMTPANIEPASVAPVVEPDRVAPILVQECEVKEDETLESVKPADDVIDITEEKAVELITEATQSYDTEEAAAETAANPAEETEDTATTTTNEVPHLTKAERKAARRAAAQATSDTNA